MARSRTLTLTVPVPRPPGGDAAGDLLGIIGLVLVVVCVGGLAGNWWISGVLGGVACVFLSWAAAKSRSTTGPAASAPSPASAAAPLLGRGRSA